MKKYLLMILLLIFSLSLQAQKDTSNIMVRSRDDLQRDISNINVSIYPVPVRENHFTIKCEKEISLVKITNIIGQDIYRMKYSNPLQMIRITLDNPRRGMYLVTIIFNDETRVVKKIMIEESE